MHLQFLLPTFGLIPRTLKFAFNCSNFPNHVRIKNIYIYIKYPAIFPYAKSIKKFCYYFNSFFTTACRHQNEKNKITFSNCIQKPWAAFNEIFLLLPLLPQSCLCCCCNEPKASMAFAAADDVDVMQHMQPKKEERLMSRRRCRQRWWW